LAAVVVLVGAVVAVATLAGAVPILVLPAARLVPLRTAAPSVVEIPVVVALQVIGDHIMKKYLSMLVALAVTLFAVNSFAWDPPASPAPKSWISDNSGVLSPAAHARLDAKLKMINQSSANEVAALVLPTLDGADIADVGDLTAKSWGVGKKGLDNGVLVVLAMKEHKSRISTGKGVEGDLPDLKTKDILDAARPYLRKGDVEGALGFIFDSASSSIANHKAEAQAAKEAAAKAGTQNPVTTTTTTTTTGSTKSGCSASGAGVSDGGGLMLLFVGGAVLLVWYLARQQMKRRAAEEAERLAAAQRADARRRQVEEREAARRRDAEKARQLHLSKPTPVVPVPEVPRPAPRSVAPPPVVHYPVNAPVTHHKPVTHPVATVAVAATAVTAAAVLAEQEARQHRAEADRLRREREEERNRRQREQDEEDRRRRQRERDEEDSRSSSSSSSSFDWGGSSSGGGSDSGGFGGGDSGGGGSSGDW